MSINSEMRSYSLQRKIKIRTESGATREEWDAGRIIMVTVKKTNDLLHTQSVRYNESTHTGLTRCKYIKPYVNRLKKTDTGEIYEIISATNDGRFNNLLLKKVDTDV